MDGGQRVPGKAEFSIGTGKFAISGGNFLARDSNVPITAGEFAIAPEDFVVPAGNVVAGDGNFPARDRNVAITAGKFAVALLDIEFAEGNFLTGRGFKGADCSKRIPTARRDAGIVPARNAPVAAIAEKRRGDVLDLPQAKRAVVLLEARHDVRVPRRAATISSSRERRRMLGMILPVSRGNFCSHGS
jgi:hypothetical protein